MTALTAWEYSYCSLKWRQLGGTVRRLVGRESPGEEDNERQSDEERGGRRRQERDPIFPLQDNKDDIGREGHRSAQSQAAPGRCPAP